MAFCVKADAVCKTERSGWTSFQEEARHRREQAARVAFDPDWRVFHAIDEASIGSKHFGSVGTVPTR